MKCSSRSGGHIDTDGLYLIDGKYICALCLCERYESIREALETLYRAVCRLREDLTMTQLDALPILGRAGVDLALVCARRELAKKGDASQKPGRDDVSDHDVRCAEDE